MVRLRALAEAFRGSLFFLPALFVVGAVALAEGLLYVDGLVDARDLPGFLQSTVESARAVLSTIAGATITVAGVVFSITMVSVQLASSQFSPRVLRGFFRDRIQQSAMGFVVGTFTYCLLVLRGVRAPLTEDVEAMVPNLAVAMAVVLGVLAALGILGFIDHGARLMHVSQLVHRIARETQESIRDSMPAGRITPHPRRAAEAIPDTPGHVIRARDQGWVQQVSAEGLRELLPPGATLRVDTRVGWFVAEGTPLCTVWPVPEDPKPMEEGLHEAVALGRVRTMQQDVAFGIRQLVDIGLRALSPGINDPTTAQETIVHLGAVLREVLLRDLAPEVVEDEEGRVLLFPHELSHGGLVGRAFDQLRFSGARQPSVAIYLLRTLEMLVREVEAADIPQAGERIEPLRRQARLVVEACQDGRALEDDLEDVRRVAAAILG